MKVELIFPQHLTSVDIRWLVISARKGWDGVQAQDLVDAAIAGTAGIYRLSGEVEGIFVLEPKGDEVRIIGLAGRGFLKHFQEVHKIICDTAKGCGGRRVTGLVARGALATLYQEHTSAKVAAVVIAEDLT